MLIDLTVPLNEQTPIYPGDPRTEIRPAGVIKKDGYQDHYVCCGTHVGTHMDAPSHMIAGGKNLNEMPVEKFSGNGVYIKVDGDFTLDVVQAADISESDIVFFHTGMSDEYHNQEYFENFPPITKEIARYLVEKKVKIVGVDMCSPDKDPFPIHKILLNNDILIIENLTDLKRLANKKFEIYAFPIKLEIDAAPVRVIAKIT